MRFDRAPKKKIMNCNVQKVLFICFIGLFSLSSIQAQSRKKTKKTTKKTTVAEVSPQLMADKVTIKRELQAVDSLMLIRQLEEEEDEFPADDLYTSTWNNQHVNPYGSSVSIPDSFRVDLTSFCMPFEGYVTSNFGPRRRRFHYGTDIKVQVGDTIRAAFDGKVRVKYYQRKGYGYYLVLRHGNGLETVYGHLSAFLVDVDEAVKAGEPIALGGNTGRSTGSHLHFEIRFLGQAINPAEIVDFKNFSTYDEFYVFKKNDNPKDTGKYTAGKAQIKYHRIKNGDTLGAVARKYGITINQLCRLNGIKPTKVLKIGSTLRCS